MNVTKRYCVVIALISQLFFNCVFKLNRWFYLLLKRINSLVPILGLPRIQ